MMGTLQWGWGEGKRGEVVEAEKQWGSWMGERRGGRGEKALWAGAVAERLCEGDVGWGCGKSWSCLCRWGFARPWAWIVAWAVQMNCAIFEGWSWRIAKQALQVPLVLLASCDSGQVWEWGMYGKESSKSYEVKSQNKSPVQRTTHTVTRSSGPAEHTNLAKSKQHVYDLRCNNREWRRIAKNRTQHRLTLKVIRQRAITSATRLSNPKRSSIRWRSPHN